MSVSVSVSLFAKIAKFLLKNFWKNYKPFLWIFLLFRKMILIILTKKSEKRILLEKKFKFSQMFCKNNNFSEIKIHEFSWNFTWFSQKLKKNIFRFKSSSRAFSYSNLWFFKNMQVTGIYSYIARCYFSACSRSREKDAKLSPFFQHDFKYVLLEHITPRRNNYSGILKHAENIFSMLLMLPHNCTSMCYTELKCFLWFSKWNRHSRQNHSDVTTAQSETNRLMYSLTPPTFAGQSL